MNLATTTNSTDAQRAPTLRSGAVLASCAAALLLAGCSSEAPEETSSESSPASEQSAASSNTSAKSAQDTQEPETTNDEAETSDSTPRCSADELKTTVEQGDSAAGHLGYTITFENTSDEACTLDGHPGLSAVGNDDGSQIGASASRVGESPESVVLIPNAHATAAVEAVNIGDDGGPLGDSCDATAADGWRIYPPNSKTSVYVEQDGLKACANKDADWVTVSAVQPVS